MKKLSPMTLLLFAFCTCANAASVVWPAIGVAPWNDGAHTYYDIGSPVSVYGDSGWCYWIVTEVVNVHRLGATLQAITGTLGNGHIWFETQYGARVDAAAVAGANYFVNMYTPEVNSIEMIRNQIFHLGVQLEYDPIVGTYAYGWASLLWDGTELALVDSAAETTGVGLYAGTYNPIPEPTTVGLLLVGLAALASRRPRRREVSSRDSL